MARTLPPHGTNARYNDRQTKCRCDECRVAHTSYMKAYRERVGSGVQGRRFKTVDGVRHYEPELRRDAQLLDVTCWCEATILRLPAQVVREGRTESCGRNTCHASG